MDPKDLSEVILMVATLAVVGHGHQGWPVIQHKVD